MSRYAFSTQSIAGNRGSIGSHYFRAAGVSPPG